MYCIFKSYKSNKITFQKKVESESKVNATQYGFTMIGKDERTIVSLGRGTGVKVILSSVQLGVLSV